MLGGKNFGPSNPESWASLWEEFSPVKKFNFLESLQISHNLKGNFNQKLMLFDFIYILSLLLEYRVVLIYLIQSESFYDGQPPYVL